MKKIIILFFSLVTLLSYTGQAIAEGKPKTEIASVKERGETVRFTLNSSQPFIFGANRYILHIGNKEFLRNEQSTDENNGKGIMTFFIPVSEYNSLADGEGIYLTYGTIKDSQNIEELSKQSIKCWSIGKFSKTLLTK